MYTIIATYTNGRTATLTYPNEDAAYAAMDRMCDVPRIVAITLVDRVWDAMSRRT